MCTPQAAAIFQVIGTVAQYSARVQQTNAENARREQARLNAARARDIQANQLAIRVKQEQDVKSQKEFDNQIAIMEAKSASKLANLGSGLAGNILRNWGNYYDRSEKSNKLSLKGTACFSIETLLLETARSIASVSSMVSVVLLKKLKAVNSPASERMIFSSLRRPSLLR